MSYEVDKAGLKRASKKLGLRFPVRVRILPHGPDDMAGKYHGLGRHGPTVDEPLDKPAHHISLSGLLGSSMANTAIWHELTHAKQCERFLPDDVEDPDEQARIANANLAMAFRQEMQRIRLKTNATSKKMTMAYTDVSFEVEALASDKKFAKKDNIIAESDDNNALLDNGKRYLWRVDLWKKGPWRANEDREYTYVETHYVNAAKEYDAKKWARDQHKLQHHNCVAVAYQIYREEN